MSRRRFLHLLILSAIFIPLAVAPVQAQGNVLRFSGRLVALEHGRPLQTGDQYIDLVTAYDTSFKPGEDPTVNSHFALRMLGPGGATDGVLIAENFIPMPGDPDWIAVSDDLGWAGIDTTVSLLDRNSGEMVDVELHIYWWAYSSYFARNPSTQARQATVEGSITVHGPRGFTIELPNAYGTVADVFTFRQFEG